MSLDLAITTPNGEPVAFARTYEDALKIRSDFEAADAMAGDSVMYSIVKLRDGNERSQQIIEDYITALDRKAEDFSLEWKGGALSDQEYNRRRYAHTVATRALNEVLRMIKE